MAAIVRQSLSAIHLRAPGMNMRRSRQESEAAGSFLGPRQEKARLVLAACGDDVSAQAFLEEDLQCSRLQGDACAAQSSCVATQDPTGADSGGRDQIVVPW
jgi:hypothetical protein